jgi:tetratricopeptide (TPR) repeat protein
VAEAHYKVVNEYLDAKNYEMAVKACIQGMNADPQDESLLMQFSFINMQMQNFGLAKHILDLLNHKKPGDFGILHNLGLAELSLAPHSGDESFLDKADGHLRKALKKTPHEPYQTLNGIGQVYLHRGNWQACLEYCERSMAIKASQPGLQETYGMALLALHKWEGFAQLDKHIPSLTRKPKPLGSEPYWDGTPGKKLFVQGEQGLGDEISFASVVADAAKENEIVLECDPRLGGLFRRSLPKHITIYPTRNGTRDWDYEPDAMCLSGTLATYYRSKGEFSRQPFLTADPERQVQWRALLDQLPGKKVGLAWKGGVPMNFASRRSLELSRLHPLLNLPGISWVSLEYKDPEDEISRYQRKNPQTHIVHWERAVGKGCDYDETAALVSELDCVVSVCTSAVHLSGALGKECHVLVPKVPRWFYESKDSTHPWYESLVLHRETEKGWPLEEVAERLCALPSTPINHISPLLAYAV